MKRKLTFRTLVWTVFAFIAVLSLSGGVGAVQGDKKVRLLDDCEPTTFNQALGEGTCIGNGHTTIDEFFAELEATQDAHKWRNQPSQMHLNVGRPLLIENDGGEVHTFTPVAAFGGGFVTPLNGISGNPVPAPECLAMGSLVFIPAGGVEEGPTAGSSDLPVGISRFQCCIHPWMRTVVEVAAPGPQSAPEAANTHRGHH
jgi:hypothetical protein